jgi:hypothetical protein
MKTYRDNLLPEDAVMGEKLEEILHQELTDAEYKIWHSHPVWFINGNPIVGYSKQKAGLRLMFWSGADFEEEALSVRGSKFKDASIFYTSPDQIKEEDVRRWASKARKIQWDYKNLIKRKGKLERIDV